MEIFKYGRNLAVTNTIVLTKLHILILLLLSVSVYWNSLDGDFVHDGKMTSLQTLTDFYWNLNLCRSPNHRQQQGRYWSQSLDISLDQRLLGDQYQGEEISQVLQAPHHHHIQVIFTTAPQHNITKSAQ